MSTLLLERLRFHATEGGKKIAIKQVWPDTGGALTYRQLSELVDRVAATLCAHTAVLPPASTVLLCSPNRPQYVAAFLGILQAGLCIFPVAPDLAEPELREAAERSGAAAIIAIEQESLPLGECFSTTRNLVELGSRATLSVGSRWAARQNTGPAMLLLSSGTTGIPKIVRRDAASLDAVAAQMARAVGFTSTDGVLAAVPLCHSYGVEHGLLAPIWAGCRVHLSDGFNLDLTRRELSTGGITLFPGVPFMYEMLCETQAEPCALPTLRRAYSAGGPLPRAVFDLFVERFGARITQLYGATEIGSVTFNPPELEPFDAATVGVAMDKVDVQILDPAEPDVRRPRAKGAEGHVAIRAASMMSGYLDGEPAPLLDGYFLTGDLGRLDALGRLTVTGRIKLLIDVGGRKVNPLEVEQVIERHPAVGACVVVPVAVSQTLFRLKAVVTPAKLGEPPDVRELRAFTKQHLSAYKVPRIFEVRESFLRSPAGKILRHLV